MEIRTFKVEFEYQHYEPGDYVTATSSRSSLEQGRVRIVREFYPPDGYDDMSGILFVDSESWGDSAEYTTPVYLGPAYPEGTPKWLIEVAEGRYEPT